MTDEQYQWSIIGLNAAFLGVAAYLARTIMSSPVQKNGTVMQQMGTPSQEVDDLKKELRSSKARIAALTRHSRNRAQEEYDDDEEPMSQAQLLEYLQNVAPVVPAENSAPSAPTAPGASSIPANLQGRLSRRM